MANCNNTDKQYLRQAIVRLEELRRDRMSFCTGDDYDDIFFSRCRSD